MTNRDIWMNVLAEAYAEMEGEATTVSILTDGGYETLSISDTISPCLLDRMWPDMWMPGINENHEQSRGLVMALPMWERSGNQLHDLHNGNNVRMGG